MRFQLKIILLNKSPLILFYIRQYIQKSFFLNKKALQQNAKGFGISKLPPTGRVSQLLHE